MDGPFPSNNQPQVYQPDNIQKPSESFLPPIGKRYGRTGTLTVSKIEQNPKISKSNKID